MLQRPFVPLADVQPDLGLRPVAGSIFQEPRAEARPETE